MRPVLAIVLAATILGGLKWYLSARPHQQHPPSETPAASDAAVTVELTLTCQAGPDRFAVEVNDPPSLVVELLGQPIFRRSGVIAAGEPLRIASLPGLVEGANELFFRATPATTDRQHPQALRAQVFHGAHPIAEAVFWADAGQAIQGSLQFALPRATDPHDRVASSEPPRR